ncbi:MAG: NADH-quinone oxidoreductase subunit G, partial [Pseudomonadota bacterium]
WAILRALSDRVGTTLPYDDLFALRQAMIDDAPVLGRLDQGPSHDNASAFDAASIGAAGAVEAAPFVSAVSDFYATNAIARASATMAECAAAARAPRLAAE